MTKQKELRVLILGCSGLIGHKLWQKLSNRFDEVFATIHCPKKSLKKYVIFENDRVIENIDVKDFKKLEGVLFAINPDVIVNCVGITKRKPEINDIIKALTINSLFSSKIISTQF